MARLPVPRLDAARLLAHEGCRDHTIRRALGLTPSQWKQLKDDTEDGELSPLMLALEEGRAEGAGEIVTFMRLKMQDEGNMRAAEWLAEHIYKVSKPSDDDNAPRVLIQIYAPLSVEDYQKVIDVDAGD